MASDESAYLLAALLGPTLLRMNRRHREEHRRSLSSRPPTTNHERTDDLIALDSPSRKDILKAKYGKKLSKSERKKKQTGLG